MWRRVILVVAMTMAVLAVDALQPRATSWVRPRTIAAQTDCQTFPETGKAVCGIFLSYWRANGGLAQQGYPISDVFKEESSNGRVYDTQYFERAVFEHHTENAGTRFEVLLSLLGVEKFKAKYPAGLGSEEPVVPVGTTLTIAGRKPGGSFRIKVVDSRRVATIQGTAAKGIFALVFLEVTNLGNEPDEARSFSLRDQQGRTFTGSLDGVLAAIRDRKGDSYGSTVQPSLTAKQVFVFDVASDASGFTIVPPTP